MVAAILAVLLASGCISSPEKGTSNSSVPTTVSTVRFVQINLLDGTIVGGKYVSETPAFTTINVMYTMDPNAHTWDSDKNYVIDLNKSFVKGNGAEVSIKNSLINTMVTIDNPTQMIEAKLQEINATIDARKKVAEEKAESIRIEKVKYEAEIAKRMPTKKSNH